jgi:hypothetical protein
MVAHGNSLHALLMILDGTENSTFPRWRFPTQYPSCTTSRMRAASLCVENFLKRLNGRTRRPRTIQAIIADRNQPQPSRDTSLTAPAAPHSKLDARKYVPLREFMF